jgi:hypothetical protein
MIPLGFSWRFGLGVVLTITIVVWSALEVLYWIGIVRLNIVAFLGPSAFPYYLLALHANASAFILARTLGTCMGLLLVHSVWNAVVPARFQLIKHSKGNL